MANLKKLVWSKSKETGYGVGTFTCHRKILLSDGIKALI